MRLSDFSPSVVAAVEAYDKARCESHGQNTSAMSDANKVSIAPMIAAACEAYERAQNAIRARQEPR